MSLTLNRSDLKCVECSGCAFDDRPEPWGCYARLNGVTPGDERYPMELHVKACEIRNGCPKRADLDAPCGQCVLESFCAKLEEKPYNWSYEDCEMLEDNYTSKDKIFKAS